MGVATVGVLPGRWTLHTYGWGDRVTPPATSIGFCGRCGLVAFAQTRDARTASLLALLGVLQTTDLPPLDDTGFWSSDDRPVDLDPVVW